jgi:drug/metabolite transporter (DMT)-like permease
MKSSFAPYAVGFIAILIWGGSPAATQLAGASIDRINVGMLRTVIAGLILLPIGLLLKLPLPTTREGWIELGVSSISGFIGFTILFSFGLNFTSTTHAALILTAAPIFTGFIGFVIDKSWPAWIWWLGAAVALIGEAILIGYRSPVAVGTATLQGDLIILAAVVFVSIGYVSGGRLASKIGTRSATAWGLSLAAIILLPVLATRMDFNQPIITAASAPSWLALAYLAILVSIVGYVTWYWALDKGGIARIAPVQFLQPLVSLALAVILFSEPITLPILIALVTVLFGVTLTTRGLRAKPN